MQATIEQEVLVKAVGRTLGVVDRRGSLPILSHCLVESNGQGVIISATDLEMSCRGKCEGEVSRPGSFTVQAHALHAVLKDIPKGPLSVEANDSVLQFEAGESGYKFNFLSPDQFPPVREVEDDGLVKVKAGGILDMMGKTMPSMSTDDYQYALSGIFWERVGEDGDLSLRLVSTDGHRLHLSEHLMPEAGRLDLGEGVIVLRKGVMEIKRFLDEAGKDATVLMGVKDNWLFFKFGDQELSVRLVEKRFPDYRRIVPQGHERAFTFNRQEMMGVVKRLSLLSNDRFKGIIFTIAPEGTVEVEHENPDIGSGREVLTLLEKEGELTKTLHVGFNARYVLDALGAMTGEKVVMEMWDRERPVKFRSPDDEWSFGLVMPMAT